MEVTLGKWAGKLQFNLITQMESIVQTRNIQHGQQALFIILSPNNNSSTAFAHDHEVYNTSIVCHISMYADLQVMPEQLVFVTLQRTIYSYYELGIPNIENMRLK